MSEFSGRRTVSIQQACEECGVARRTIYNWLYANKIEHVRTAGGNVRIFADTLFKKGTQCDQARNGNSDVPTS